MSLQTMHWLFRTTVQPILLTAALLSTGVFAQTFVDPGLAAHIQRMSKPELLQIGERVHWAKYYDYSNFGFIEGDTALIAVDCGWWPGAVAEAVEDLRARTDKPVRYILYTHGHADHLGGCSAIADRDSVEVIANEQYVRYRDEMVSSRLPFIARRATDQMGFLLPQGPTGSVGAGVGPGFYRGEAAYYPPTRLVAPDSEFELDGVRIVLMPTPVDIDDAISVYLPDERILFPGDAIIGTGPVIATPRQEKGRDPYLWMESLERLDDVDFAYLLPGHGPAYTDGASGRKALQKARDTIQFIVDHVVRGLNAKVEREEIIASLELPVELADDPDLGWYYHSLKWVARGVYTNFAGWYADTLEDLFEIDPVHEARLLTEALGGVDAALAVARQHLDSGQRDFAGRLLAKLLRVAPDHAGVVETTISALRAGAYAASSTSQRNYMLMEANSLEGTYDRSRSRPFIDVVSLLSSVPTDRLLANITPRLKPDTDPALNTALLLSITDRGELYTLNIRRGVLRVVSGIDQHLIESDPPRLAMHSDDLVQYVLRTLTVREALEQDRFDTQDVDRVLKFFTHMDE